jgi:hypothetical protein
MMQKKCLLHPIFSDFLWVNMRVICGSFKRIKAVKSDTYMTHAKM